MRLGHHGPREGVAAWISSLRETIDFGTSRIWQTDQFGCLVETLSRRIVHRAAKDMMLQKPFNMNQQGMASAHDQRNGRLKIIKSRSGRIACDPRGIEMRFMVMNAGQRN